jgi:hypothetical protein
VVLGSLLKRREVLQSRVTELDIKDGGVLVAEEHPSTGIEGTESVGIRSVACIDSFTVRLNGLRTAINCRCVVESVILAIWTFRDGFLSSEI